MTKSFTVTVGTTPTPLVAPDWVNPLALPFATQTASFSLTAAMLGLTVPYNSAAAGTVTIPTGLTPVIGASVLLGQMGDGALTVAGGATITGPCTQTYGPNHVLRAVQTALNVWQVSTYSWDLTKFLGNPNAQPLLVSYGQITFTGNGVLIDTNPNLVVGGNGVSLVTGQPFTKNYGNGPGEIWYGIAAAASPVQVMTGPGLSTL